MPAKDGSKKPRKPILKYSPVAVSRGIVKKDDLRWRKKQGIPERCDNDACCFYSKPLVWNGKFLPLILDHREGNRYDNSPGSLWLLCPNCDSQLPTRGGANRGRVREKTADGYVLVNRDGSKIVAATGRASTRRQKQQDQIKT